jgi:hypothetical protein
MLANFDRGHCYVKVLAPILDLYLCGTAPAAVVPAFDQRREAQVP